MTEQKGTAGAVTLQIVFPAGTPDRDVELILERVRTYLTSVYDCTVEVVSDETVDQ